MPKSCAVSKSEKRWVARVNPWRHCYQATLIIEQLSPLPMPIKAT
jgi:hypothetical protein